MARAGSCAPQTVCSHNGAGSPVSVSVKKGCVLIQTRERTFQQRSWGRDSLLPKTSSKIAGVLAQMMCHPVETWFLPQNATVRLTSSPFKMFAFLPLDHVLEDTHPLRRLCSRGTAQRLTAGQWARDRREGERLRRVAHRSVCCSDPYNHSSQQTRGRHVEFSSYNLYATAYLV